jgi:N-acetylglucosaminyldiphosphoundecaprenol N-acetyl-beta-D-mannosaminyltransferase
MIKATLRPGSFPLPRANVLGVGVHAVDLDRTLTALESALATGKKGYVCVTGVHGVMEAQRDQAFRAILNDSFLTVPDGMPTVWVGRVRGFSHMRRVFGPDLMQEVCRKSVSTNWRHFLFGGEPGVADQLKQCLEWRFPGLKIVGTYTPPFRPLLPLEESELIALVSAAKPDIFWVGLSTPKQERFMAEYLSKLETKVMVGVGAAFDLHTGRIKDAPVWIKNAGLQWFHRLCQDPRRLWKRYLKNNPEFVIRILFQFLGVNKYQSI